MNTNQGKIIISGGKPLNGEIAVSGMKNAAVAIVLSTILTEDKCVIENLPSISDVKVSLEILQSIGVKVNHLDRNTVEIDASVAAPCVAPYDLVNKMRASYYLIGAELGCTRPVAEEEQLLPSNRYIGVSGVNVKPDLYIALGVSGQVQHTSGVTAGRVIAVNKDDHAPIFSECDLGVVGEIKNVLPGLIASLSAKD